MPSAATSQASLQDAAQEIAALFDAAKQFVAPDRGEAMARKWLGRRDIEAESEEEMIAATADSVVLAADLLLSQPAASGMTAFDRLARSRASASAAEAAAIGALRQSRFRLLRLEGDAEGGDATARDVMSGEVLRIVGAELPGLPAGTMLFGRAVMLDGATCCMSGAITPLDAAALAMARDDRAALHGGARWAEAVYGHVVRHGTLEIPGLNRPDEDADDGPEYDELVALAADWAELAEGAADAELLHRTRLGADPPGMLGALDAMAEARDAGEAAMARAFERLLLVQMETLQHREQSGLGTWTLDAVGRALDEAIAEDRLPAGLRGLFAGLRKRLGGGARARAEDPALERLMQRIQGLRAKTTERGCTEQEAMAAAEKVAELLDRHGLSLDELEFRAQPCDGIPIQTNRRRVAPIDGCVPSIAAFFDCRVWGEQAEGGALRYMFFGLRGDVAAARYLYEMVERAFETETAAFRAGAVYAAMAGARRTAFTSFQVGLAQGICGKLAAIQEARAAYRRSASGQDLVPVKAAIVDEEMARLGLALRVRTAGRGRRILAEAYAAGEDAGGRFEVVPGVRGV